jgi:hypothetical protein
MWKLYSTLSSGTLAPVGYKIKEGRLVEDSGLWTVPGKLGRDLGKWVSMDILQLRRNNEGNYKGQ